MEKKPPHSDLYGHVTSGINTGASMSKVFKKYDEGKLNVLFRRNENFRRLKPQKFSRLLNSERTEVLVLDLRDEEQYEKFRVVGAVSYPVALLSRAVNPFIPEILEFANKEPARIIVIYHEHERVSVNAANLFFEKGLDNVFMLHGGINDFVRELPNMVAGEIPRELLPKAPARRPRSAISRLSDLTYRPSSARSVSTLALSGKKSSSTNWR